MDSINILEIYSPGKGHDLLAAGKGTEFVICWYAFLKFYKITETNFEVLITNNIYMMSYSH